jgi:hypothetical protein
MPTADVYRLIAVPSFIFFPSHLSLVVSFTGIKLSAAKPRPGSGFGAIGFVAGPLRLTSADDAYSRDNENESGVEVALSGGAIPERYWVLLRLGRASGCLGGSTLGNKQR